MAAALDVKNGPRAGTRGVLSSRRRAALWAEPAASPPVEPGPASACALQPRSLLPSTVDVFKDVSGKARGAESQAKAVS